MVDVILDTQDIKVLGGPSIVNLELDFGKPGSRGSYIYAGPGKPSEETLPASYQINDLYINLDGNDDEYTYVYQYTATVADEVPINDWVKLVKLVPTVALGTAAERDVPAVGDAGPNQVVLGNDTRLSATASIEDNSITTPKIVNGAVTNSKLQHSSVTINGQSVSLGGSTTISTSAEIPDGSITNQKLQNSSITLNGQPVALGGSATIQSGVSQTNGTVTTASTSAGVVRNIYLSTSSPSGGMDGDVWMVYS